MDVVIALMLSRDITLLHIFCDIINSISLISNEFQSRISQNNKFILNGISYS